VDGLVRGLALNCGLRSLHLGNNKSLLSHSEYHDSILIPAFVALCDAIRNNGKSGLRYFRVEGQEWDSRCDLAISRLRGDGSSCYPRRRGQRIQPQPRDSSTATSTTRWVVNKELMTDDEGGNNFTLSNSRWRVDMELMPNDENCRGIAPQEDAFLSYWNILALNDLLRFDTASGLWPRALAASLVNKYYGPSVCFELLRQRPEIVMSRLGLIEI